MEINESKIISSSSEIYWIFGLVDHITKEARIFTVLNYLSYSSELNSSSPKIRSFTQSPLF